MAIATRVTAPRPVAEASPAQQVQPQRVDSRALLGGALEILIDHQQQTYRLRQTAQGKLILTK